MKEEKNGASQNKWRQIIRKKWFFPAVYIAIAAIFLTVVIWYQSLDRNLPEVENHQDVITDQYSPNNDHGDVEAVMDQQEVLQMPVENKDEAEIVTKFYDYDADEEDQEQALVLHENHYYPSTGVDIKATDEESFEVLAALSGTVSETKTDPILGNVVVLEHDQDVMTYYASLGETSVEEGDNIKQGEVIGNAGENELGKDNGTHLHFELRKNDQTFNPEEYFEEPIGKLADVIEDKDQHEEDEENEEQNEDDEHQQNDRENQNDNHQPEDPIEDGTNNLEE